jgi:mono/diheme cytochrome c family protein
MPRVLSSILILMTVAASADELPGAALYRQKQCVACHAADGSGNTPAGKATRARDLRSAEVQKSSDDALADAIANGRGKMPAYKSSLSSDQIKELVAFLRSLRQ